MIALVEEIIFANRYQLQRLLGRGGFSEVWLAVDTVTNMEVAIKVYAPGRGMDTDGMKDFCRELSQVYNLNHTNLLKPQHVDNWEGMPYMVMTYCPKGSCHRLIGQMKEEQIWKLLHDVAAGLAYLHQQNIIHQDIKPDNILVDPQGNYVITDFGISVQSRSTLRKSMSAVSGSGTTAYMGPERFSIDPTPLKASDIWSLGATAYELLTGNPPFGEIGGGLQKGGADLPTIKQDISSELRILLSKMLSLDTWNRPTADQLLTWIENPQTMDFNVNTMSMKQNDITTFQADGQKKSNKGTAKSIIIGVSVVTLLVLIGGATLFIHFDKKAKAEAEQKEFVDRGIQLHIELSKSIDKFISDMNDRNVVDKLDLIVMEMRKLEKLENESRFAPIYQIKFSPEKMKSFCSRLVDIKKILENSLVTTYADYDKDGAIYQRVVYKLERINAVFKDLELSENKSANDIHLRSDEF